MDICDVCGHSMPSKGVPDYSGWISVEDRLPKKYARVLVTDGKEVCIHYKQSGCNFPDERGHDLYCGGKYDDCNIYEGQVTYWMPLPKPPKE